jgi:hypothetical protein
VSQRCPNGRFDDNQPHDFDVPTSFETMGAAPVMYCRQCGEVRALRVTNDDGPPNVATSDDIRQIAKNAKAYRRERGYIKEEPS